MRKWMNFETHINSNLSLLSIHCYCYYLPMKFEIQVHHENSLLLLLILVFQTSHSFGMVFLNCELCQSLSNQFDNMCYDMVQFDWYICPRDLKRILPMITHFTQQELIIECFGSISCNREAFKKVSQLSLA